MLSWAWRGLALKGSRNEVLSLPLEKTILKSDLITMIGFSLVILSQLSVLNVILAIINHNE